MVEGGSSQHEVLKSRSVRKAENGLFRQQTPHPSPGSLGSQLLAVLGYWETFKRWSFTGGSGSGVGGCLAEARPLPPASVVLPACLPLC